jgi:hypothetical protein
MGRKLAKHDKVEAREIWTGRTSIAVLVNGVIAVMRRGPLETNAIGIDGGEIVRTTGRRIPDEDTTLVLGQDHDHLAASLLPIIVVVSP